MDETKPSQEDALGPRCSKPSAHVALHFRLSEYGKFPVVVLAVNGMYGIPSLKGLVQGDSFPRRVV